MNMQAMLKQAQNLQKKMVEEQRKIEEKEFTGKSSFVTIIVKGNKEVVSVKLDTESIEQDEIEMVEDMIMVAFNDCMKQIDKETQEKLGKYTQGLPGLF